jgi:hypothetical protein
LVPSIELLLKIPELVVSINENDSAPPPKRFIPSKGQPSVDWLHVLVVHLLILALFNDSENTSSGSIEATNDIPPPLEYDVEFVIVILFNVTIDARAPLGRDGIFTEIHPPFPNIAVVDWHENEEIYIVGVPRIVTAPPDNVEVQNMHEVSWMYIYELVDADAHNIDPELPLFIFVEETDAIFAFE